MRGGVTRSVLAALAVGVIVHSYCKSGSGASLDAQDNSVVFGARALRTVWVSVFVARGCLTLLWCEPWLACDGCSVQGRFMCAEYFKQELIGLCFGSGIGSIV